MAATFVSTSKDAPSQKRLRLDPDMNSKKSSNQIPVASEAPSGYRAMHTLRELTTCEWKKILADDGKYNPLGRKDVAGWEKLKTKLKVSK